jgi:signal transduction histidine kinase
MALHTWREKLDLFLDRRIPAALAAKPETLRRSRLIIRFSVLGALFGGCYATFYGAIGHYWGAAIIVCCSLGITAIPRLLRFTGSIEWAGNCHALILTSGFIGLCCIEGGVNGHAIAWLVSVPLCALLLAGKRSALIWCGICLLAVIAILIFNSFGYKCPILYPARWHNTITAVGYLGLIAFMFLLGRIFEIGREEAFEQMTMALVELSQANLELQRLNDEKDEFFGIAAHDLKNPLTAIKCRSELLLIYKHPTPKQIQDSAQQIIAASSRMHELITNLLDLNAFEQGKFRARLEPCLVGPIIRRCISDQAAAASKKRIEILVGEIDPALTVIADAKAFIQVIENLLSNALKFSPRGKTVCVRAAAADSVVVFEIEDEGPGITEADQLRMFEKFGRLSAQPTGGESSTGLGLSIVKKMLQSMSGSITCRSVVGQGTTFSVSLPRADNPVLVAALERLSSAEN